MKLVILKYSWLISDFSRKNKRTFQDVIGKKDVIGKHFTRTFFKVIEPSEHGGAIHKPLIGTTVNCVGVNEPFYLKPPLRGRFWDDSFIDAYRPMSNFILDPNI